MVLVDAYATWLVNDPTYLYECFEDSTPTSFLKDFVRTVYIRRDPNFFIFTVDGAILVREHGSNYVETTMDRLIVAWYSQCEKVCSLAIRMFDGGTHGSIQNTITYPKMRPRLSSKAILAHLERLRFQFEHRIDMDVSSDFIERMIKT
jgi:hypothetical protein